VKHAKFLRVLLTCGGKPQQFEEEKRKEARAAHSSSITAVEVFHHK